tara:strand:+ start:3183 stop:4037 length:855 start_codon:yes stop_codon:yes gene_type:complete
MSEANSQTRAQKRKQRREERKIGRNVAGVADKLLEMQEGKKPFKRGGLGIDQLRYQFDQGARPNRFTVDFYCPNLNIALEGVRCVNASLPGRQIEAGDFSTYGPLQKMPFNVGMDGQEVSFQFICDSSFADRFIIEAWQGAIFGGTANVGKAFDSPDAPNQGNSVNPQFSYYNDYVGEIVIKQITRSDKKSLQYRIYEAYPISFSPMELASDQTDSLMRFECTFAFRTWESEYSNPNPVSGINKGRRFLDILSSVTNLKKGGNSANDTLQRFNDRLARLGGFFD